MVLTFIKNEISVLLVDSDGAAHRTLSLALGKEKYKIELANSIETALEMLEQKPFDIILVDSEDNRHSIFETVKRIRQNHIFTEIIVLGDSSDGKTAVQALQAGAIDCIKKPYSNEQLLLRLGKAAEHLQLRQELTALRQDIAMNYGFDNIVGASDAIRQLKETIGRIAPTDIPVLITGDKGTGKGLIARILHHHSHRRRGAFVHVNCASMNETQLETILFGSTGDSSHSEQGIIESALKRADGGTLFLDAVDSMPLSVQLRLVSFLRDFKLNSDNFTLEKKIDLRTIAATEIDLAAHTDEGRFLKDLYQRLDVINVRIPALIEWIEDIEILADYLIRKITAGSDKRQPTISRQAIEKLAAYNWPGNVRELENTLKRALVYCKGDHLKAEDISLTISDRCPNSYNRISSILTSATTESLLEDNQRAVIRKALIDNNWNFTQTAQALGIGRTTLWRKVKKYDLKRDAVPNKP